MAQLRYTTQRVVGELGARQVGDDAPKQVIEGLNAKGFEVVKQIREIKNCFSLVLIPQQGGNWQFQLPNFWAPWGINQDFTIDQILCWQDAPEELAKLYRQRCSDIIIADSMPRVPPPGSAVNN
jgi:hypothetical protein